MSNVGSGTGVISEELSKCMEIDVSKDSLQLIYSEDLLYLELGDVQAPAYSEFKSKTLVRKYLFFTMA